ncbi:MAG: hypothetical protein FIA95_05975 [Gemmatimonadetes bacterium]|nr:hypothetical protein [Gemmatimonadota bacterium]
MGRPALLTLAALAVLACEPAPQSRAAEDPHARLACAECHNGALAARSLAAVPPQSCTSSRCHASVPEKVRLATVSFTHAAHGSSGSLPVDCAGCHAHAAGGEPVRAGSDACGLCHEDALAGRRGEDCRYCHSTPTHMGMTSQGVVVPHQGLPWIEGGCLRCHYAVTLPAHEVPLARCGACHDDVEAMTTSGIGRDLHPAHPGIACGSCHERDNHRIQAMSSSVNLECEACHTQEHGVAAARLQLGAGTCNVCHQGVHAEPQRVLLGILADAAAALPSQHFMDGVTCASCHIAPDDADPTVLSGTAQACVQCHRSEYAQVLTWWNQGIEERLRLVDRYLAGAEGAVAALSAEDPASQAAARARRMLETIRVGGGQHNLPLAHRTFEDAVAGAREAYRLAGASVPSAPALGRAPRQGVCAFCHYRLTGPGFSERMDDAFHREVLKVGG